VSDVDARHNDGPRPSRRPAPADLAAPSDLAVPADLAAPAPASAVVPATALALQRTVGNRALSGLVAPRLAASRPVPQVQRVGAVISAPPKAGTSEHPTLSKAATNNAQAVMEAQQKLASSPGGPKDLVADGSYNTPTVDAVKAFRVKNGKPESDVVDAEIWALLDAQGKSSVGRIERTWQQTLMGTVYGMTSKYSYRIEDKQIVVSVGINFVADADHPPKDLSAVVDKWKLRILGRWNLFKAVKDGGGDARDIVFEIVPTGGNTVTVIDAMVGSDASHWSVPDNEHDNGPAHEFGHMIGLADEYKQSLSEHQRMHPGASAKDVEKAKGAYYGGDQYTDESSMMGMGALADHADKAADPEPRHVREFARYVEKYVGGTWEVAKK
jgi:peptidoglycan hydrolase-like protein with peptidoglycan-binding domain